MKRFRLFALSTVALLLLAGSMTSTGAFGQQKTLKEQIIGAWTYVSGDAVFPDGKRTPMYGPDPKGFVILDATGHYALVNARSGLPKFVTNNRLDGTAEEHKAIVQGSIAHFGRYTVNDVDSTVTFHIETSTFPNWNGVEQRRPFTLSGDELKWTTPGASGGGNGEIVLKRAN